MMYVCGDGHIFDEPVLLKEDYYDRGEKLYGCPVCGQGFEECIDEVPEHIKYEIEQLKEDIDTMQEDISHIEQAISCLNEVINLRKSIRNIEGDLRNVIFKLNVYIMTAKEELKELE